MAVTTHSARITGPVPYPAGDGVHRNIPLGPCLVEEGEGPLAEIIWGDTGQNCVSLATDDMATAQSSGNLVLLD